MQAVIIAAGDSSRFWPLNKEHKSLTSVLGKSLIYWTIKGLIENGITNIMVVCKTGSSIPEALKKENDLSASFHFVFQEKSLGTGNALWQAKEFITEPFFVVWPNKIDSKAVAAKMIEKKKAEGLHAVFAGAKTNAPHDNGMARFEGDRLVEIQEKPEHGKEPSDIKIVGFHFLEPDFFDYYTKLPKHHETDLVDAINTYIKEKKSSIELFDEEVPTLKYPWDLFSVLDILLKSENFKPGIAKSAIIGSNVTIKGQVFIGENAIVKDNTVIEGPCFIGENCVIGHSNVLRGPLSLERGVKTGAFCEIKHSIVQEETHFHSGFIGDSLIGNNCRFGAGFITGNRRFDRKTVQVVVKGKKIDTMLGWCGTIVGDNTALGIQSGTMPGVLIGSNCVVGPGTQVFKNMADNERVV